MDHVVHIGEVHQVFSIPAQAKGRSLALRQVEAEKLLGAK